MTSKRRIEVRNHHEYVLCEECKDMHRHVGYSWGKWLCRTCQNKSILGTGDKKKWGFENKFIHKKVVKWNLWLDKSDCRFLCEKYNRLGLTYKETRNKIKGLRLRISSAHRKYILLQQEEETSKDNVFVLPSTRPMAA